MWAISRCILLLLLIWAGPVRAQLIHGETIEMDTNTPLAGVEITNIYTGVTIPTAADGSFVVAAAADQLLEFRKAGYKMARVRIPNGYLPRFFRIILQPGFSITDGLLADISGRERYRRDSIKYRELFKHDLDFPRMSAIEKIKSPFSALSARNKAIWRFQDTYDDFEKERYVDYIFNKELVTSITGLSGDSLDVFMMRFRPSYNALRGMNDYSYYTYIKNSSERFRNINRPIRSQ